MVDISHNLYLTLLSDVERRRKRESELEDMVKSVEVHKQTVTLAFCCHAIFLPLLCGVVSFGSKVKCDQDW